MEESLGKAREWAEARDFTGNTQHPAGDFCLQFYWDTNLPQTAGRLPQKFLGFLTSSIFHFLCLLLWL